MLNRGGKSRYASFVFDLIGKSFSFSVLSVLLAVYLSYMAFIVLRNIASICNLLRVFFLVSYCDFIFFNFILFLNFT